MIERYDFQFAIALIFLCNALSTFKALWFSSRDASLRIIISPIMMYDETNIVQLSSYNLINTFI